MGLCLNSSLSEVFIWGPSKLTEELTRAGFRIWEALEESEIKHLCATEDVDGIVLAHDIPWRKEIAARSGRVCVLLEPYYFRIPRGPFNTVESRAPSHAPSPGTAAL